MSTNITVLEGRLGNAPEVTATEKSSYVRFSIATEDGWGDNKKTNWHNCIAFGKISEVIGKHFGKGDGIVITGRVDYNKKDDKTYTSIIVNDFSFPAGKNTNNIEVNEPTTPATEGNDDLPF